MATKTLYLLDSMLGEFATMQDGGTAPTAATFATQRFNTSKTAANNFFKYLSNFSNSTSSTTDPIATAAAPSDQVTGSASAGGDAFVSPSPLTGTFANTNWTFTLKLRCGTASTQSYELHARIWKGANANGSGAIELTSAVLVGATTGAMSSTTTTYDSSITWSSPGSFTFNNEYLFLQLSLRVVVAGGTNGADAKFRQGESFITTPDLSVVITGPYADTEDPDAAAFAGTVLVSGPYADNEDPDVAAIAGNVAWQGTFAPIDGLDTATFPGIIAWQGTFAATDAIDTAAIAGQILAGDNVGTFALTESALDSFASPGSITGTFFNPSRTAGRITLSNSNLTATRAS